MAGQSVGMVTHEQPVAAIIEALVGQARLALDVPQAASPHYLPLAGLA